MADPLSAAGFRGALVDEGVQVDGDAGWQTHNRNAGRLWGPVQGVMLHHTAGRSSLGLVRSGTRDLPGPLCIALVQKDGAVRLVGYGRTNHAGAGSAAVFAALTRGAVPPGGRPGPDEVDGNRYLYGVEIENLGDGKDPYPAVQMDAVVRLAAGVCRAHGWSSNRVIGHKEWTRRKVDPSFSMPDMRGWVAGRLGGVPVSSGLVVFPGASFFTVGRRSAVITAMGRRLVQEGCGRYRVGPGPEWTDVDRASYRAWQEKLGYRGAGADGIPGRVSWDRLRVPRA